MIVDYHLDNRYVIAACRRQFIHIHAKTPVARNIDADFVRPPHLRADACAKTIAHGAESA